MDYSGKPFLVCLFSFFLCSAHGQTNSNPWVDQPGEGFRASAQSFSLQMGAGHGIHLFGGNSSHDLAITSLTYGHMLGNVKGQDHWYRGNWELRGELFGGSQFDPSAEYLAGLAPHLRYDFASGSRWMPYEDIGGGVTASSIERPDLGGAFEFNLQTATGVMYFITDNMALDAQVRFMHLSSARIEMPNIGVNTLFGLVGVSWFF